MLRDKIQNDMKTALKAGEKEKLSAIRMLWSAVKNKEIDAKHDLDDAEIAGIVESCAKQRRDSIDQFKKGNRPDLVKKEENELAVLLAYLPQQLSNEELDKLVEEAVRESGASSPADMGKVMKLLMPKTKGLADGKAVSQKVTEKLKPQ